MMIAFYVVLGLAVFLVLLVFVLYLIGKGMDPKHEWSCRMRLRQPVEQVFALIEDVSGWPGWDPGVTRVEVLPPTNGNPTCRMWIGRNPMLLVTTRTQAPQFLERTIEDTGKDPMFSGSWLHELSSLGTNLCEVKLTERGTIHSPLARAMARKLADPRMYLKRHLRRVAEKFGEQAEIA